MNKSSALPQGRFYCFTALRHSAPRVYGIIEQKKYTGNKKTTVKAPLDTIVDIYEKAGREIK